MSPSSREDVQSFESSGMVPCGSKVLPPRKVPSKMTEKRNTTYEAQEVRYSHPLRISRYTVSVDWSQLESSAGVLIGNPYADLSNLAVSNSTS